MEYIQETAQLTEQVYGEPRIINQHNLLEELEALEQHMRAKSTVLLKREGMSSGDKMVLQATF